MIKSTVTKKDRQKAQPKAVMFLTDPERDTIKETVAKDLTIPQFKVYIYTCQALGLNPLLNEIAVVVYNGKMSIQVMRDGFLSIAHRSGKFAGLESGVYEKGQKTPDGRVVADLVGWAKAYHQDFKVPVYQEADLNEYDAKKNVWLTKPKTMIKKVAESMALRKAFNVNGAYSPEEMEKEIISAETARVVPQLENGNEKADPSQIVTLEGLGVPTEEAKKLTKQQAAEKVRELGIKKVRNDKPDPEVKKE